MAYGLKFDYIQLPRKGRRCFVEGTKFYSYGENQLYSEPLLKLHGSLNWFRYLPTGARPSTTGGPEPQLHEKEEVFLLDDVCWSGCIPEHDGRRVDPIIITPALYGKRYKDRIPFQKIWGLAEEKLSEAEKLLIMGYSFSSRDRTTRKLFREAFRKNKLKEIILVDPNRKLMEDIKKICNFKEKVVWYKNLDNYMRSIK